MSVDDRTDALTEAARQVRICNACRYCEGYCAAFRTLTGKRAHDAGDILLLANLCHDCRGCYYSCQYAPPHEFDLNLPAALSAVRRQSWEDYLRPRALARLFQRHAAATALALAAGLALMILAVRWIGGSDAPGFYGALSHGAMVAIFAPAFLLPLVLLADGLRRYWNDIGGTSVRWRQLCRAARDAARLRNLDGGHGEGCNFERGERFSLARRHAHHAVMYGFLMCFGATATGTVLHYVLALPAPYPLLSVPKLLGVPGGVLLAGGCAAMLWLRTRADPGLSDPASRGGSAAFVILLGLAAVTGLALYGLRETPWMAGTLAAHLGTVLAFFVSIPFSKMAHAPFRAAALLRQAQLEEAGPSCAAARRPAPLPPLRGE